MFLLYNCSEQNNIVLCWRVLDREIFDDDSGEQNLEPFWETLKVIEVNNYELSNS
jgi:hypothetical protein